MRLAIVGWIKTVEWLQWYDVTAEPGGVLESEGHQRGSVECLTVQAGEFEVEAGDETRRAGPATRCATAATATMWCAASRESPAAPAWSASSRPR